jgi:hypothetical protein
MDASIKAKLIKAANAHDFKNVGKPGYNIWASAHYEKAIDAIEEDVDKGKSLARALYDNASDRFLSALEKAVGLPLTYGGGGKDRGRPE